MHFDYLPSSQTKYLSDILSIIKNGISIERNRLTKSHRENLKNQQLSERFSRLGALNEQNWIGVGKENENSNSQNREDIYFYLDDDDRTRIFFAEGKRLPKARTKNEEEYVVGVSSTGSPSGGIQRFKLGLHGQPETMTDYAIIAYVENGSFSSWQTQINSKIASEYPTDSELLETPTNNSDYISSHNYIHNHKKFRLHHFWIDLS